ncbi:MAG: malate dehydrogenase [Actinobacteria bacterium]|nr:malate dehydrogenase [Actinomycetota bacterium]
MEKLNRIAVIGCGNVGTQFAFLAAAAGYSLYLYDVVEGLAKGRALDIMQAQRPLQFETSVQAIDDLSEASEANLWVITAGKPRKPGMSRADLANENIKIISTIAEKAKEAREDSIFIIVTNPLDIIVTKFMELTGFDRNRVLGMGGILDSARMSYFISKKTGVPAHKIESWVLGAHSDSMVPCFSLTKIDGQPAGNLLSEDDKKWVFDKTVNGGAEIVSYLKTGSAFLAPGASAYYLARAVLEDERLLLPVSVFSEGEYGFSEVAIGLPVEVGSRGAMRVVQLTLEEDEHQLLRRSYEEIKSFLKEI